MTDDAPLPICEHCRGEATDCIQICGRSFFYCDFCMSALLDSIEIKFNRGLEL